MTPIPTPSPTPDEPIIDKLERLEREATPGPWKISDKTPVVVVIPGGGANGNDWQFDAGDRYPDVHNASLIVASRNALPALLSQLREQRERAAEVEPLRRYLAREQERLTAAERTIREQREFIEAASKFREKHERFHPDHWCATNHSRGRCDSCDFCAALAPDTEEPEATMPRVGGKPFRCDCGGNVFSRTGTRYVCNSCGTEYEGTPLVPDAEEGE